MLKIKGVFRIFRVFILVRKLNAVRLRAEMRKKVINSDGYDLRSPMEKVIEILNDIRDSLNMSETKIIGDLNYCIKMISTNKLYDTPLDFDDESSSDQIGALVQKNSKFKPKSEVLSWHASFAAGTPGHRLKKMESSTSNIIS